MTFDASKLKPGDRVLLRDGTKARIYATDGPKQSPNHGALYDPRLEFWETGKWSQEGEFYSDINLSLPGLDIVSLDPEFHPPEAEKVLAAMEKLKEHTPRLMEAYGNWLKALPSIPRLSAWRCFQGLHKGSVKYFEREESCPDFSMLADGAGLWDREPSLDKE